MARLRKDTKNGKPVINASNSGSTLTFQEVIKSPVIEKKKLRGRAVAVTSRAIKKKIKKPQTKITVLANRTYSLSPEKNDFDFCSILQTPIASSTCVADNIPSPISISDTIESATSSVIVISPTIEMNNQDKLGSDKLAKSSIPVSKTNLCKNVTNKNFFQNIQKNNLVKNSKVTFGDTKIISRRSSIGLSVDASDKENISGVEIIPDNSTKSKNIVYSSAFQNKLATGSAKKNISYVKPCNIRPTNKEDSENTIPPKREYLKTPLTKSALDTRAKLRRSGSQPLMIDGTTNIAKSLKKTSSTVWDKTTQKITKPSRLRMPNFAMIHRKKFENMESVQEFAQRKAERAKNLLTPKAVKNAPLRINGVNSAFGEIKKNVTERHTKHVQMAKKIPTKASSFTVRRQDILKGVRLNKRFDLQLQYRKGL